MAAVGADLRQEGISDQGRRCGRDAEEMKIKIRIKTEWDMEYRIWDIDRADEERLKTTG